MANYTGVNYSPKIPNFPTVNPFLPCYGKFDLTTYIQGASDYEIMANLVQLYNIMADGYNKVEKLSVDTATAFNQLQDFVNDIFSDPDLNNILQNVLTNMFKNGTMQKYLEPLLGHITPEMFGATGDGTTDDTIALKRTFDYMKENGFTNLLLTGKYRITQKIQVIVQQLKITGINTDPACILCDGTDGCIEIGDGDTKLFGIIMRDFWIKGSHNNVNSLITFRNCWNCYYTNFHVSDGGKDTFQIHFTDHSGIIFFNNCTIEGGSDVNNLPADRNGLLIDTNGSILSFSGGNVWNLNTFIKFNNATNKFNLDNNWIECVRNLCLYDLTNFTESRYVDVHVNNNAISIHNYKTIVYTYFTFLQFNGTSKTNYSSSNISVTNNKIYIWDAVITNNSLIDFIGNMQPNGLAHITYENNTYSGKTLLQLNAYVFKNNINITNSEVTIDAVKTINADFTRLSDTTNIVNAILYNINDKQIHAPTGLNVGTETTAGLIRYFDDNFYFKFKEKQGLIRETEYLSVTLKNETGYSEQVAYPADFNTYNTTVTAIKVQTGQDEANARVGINVGISTTPTALFAEMQANGIAVYNNDPNLYGRNVIILLSKIY